MYVIRMITMIILIYTYITIHKYTHAYILGWEMIII